MRPVDAYDAYNAERMSRWFLRRAPAIDAPMT